MPAISAALVGSLSPQIVQVALSGLTVGDSYEIQGSAGGYTWPVRGATGVAAATQVVFSDLATPINVPVTYVATVNDVVAATSAPITVPWAPAAPASARYLLSSLDGRATAAFRWMDNADPRDIAMRVTLHSVEGRTRPVSVYDLEAGETNTFVVRTDGTNTDDLRTLIRSGAPMLLRTDGSLRDFPAVEFVQVTSASRAIVRDTLRQWSLGVAYLDDPEPDTVVPASTWDDFDLVYVASTWTAFDSEWAGQTWDDFDLEDWDSRA